MADLVNIFEGSHSRAFRVFSVSGKADAGEIDTKTAAPFPLKKNYGPKSPLVEKVFQFHQLSPPQSSRKKMNEYYLKY
jgi:hypothetical protein